jgi:hypothetical protein
MPPPVSHLVLFRDAPSGIPPRAFPPRAAPLFPPRRIMRSPAPHAPPSQSHTRRDTAAPPDRPRLPPGIPPPPLRYAPKTDARVAVAICIVLVSIMQYVWQVRIPEKKANPEQGNPAQVEAWSHAHGWLAQQDSLRNEEEDHTPYPIRRALPMRYVNQVITIISSFSPWLHPPKQRPHDPADPQERRSSQRPPFNNRASPQDGSQPQTATQGRSSYSSIGDQEQAHPREWLAHFPPSFSSPRCSGGAR